MKKLFAYFLFCVSMFLLCMCVSEKKEEPSKKLPEKITVKHADGSKKEYCLDDSIFVVYSPCDVFPNDNTVREVK